VGAVPGLSLRLLALPVGVRGEVRGGTGSCAVPWGDALLAGAGRGHSPLCLALPEILLSFSGTGMTN